jgi:hypothetical protein
MKELLVLLEDELHARRIGLHILTGIWARLHRPDGAAIADKMLFMVAAMERELIRERTLDGLRAAEAQGRRGGRPPKVDDDALAIARSRCCLLDTRHVGGCCLRHRAAGTQLRYLVRSPGSALPRGA